YFLNARNESTKRGLTHIRGGFFTKGTSKFYISLPVNKKGNERKDVYLTLSCYGYMILLCELVLKLYTDYGALIDPDQYYSLEGIGLNNLKIEDIEEEIIGIRGWTDIESASKETRLNTLKLNVPTSQINDLFQKYLGGNKP
ncbi:MAG: hypothetical protein OXB88_04335, partial [Bacteriovoracales bacterium]|nr:hypothetical protein [Bacteriovoracales bacterium]